MTASGTPMMNTQPVKLTAAPPLIALLRLPSSRNRQSARSSLAKARARGSSSPKTGVFSQQPHHVEQCSSTSPTGGSQRPYARSLRHWRNKFHLLLISDRPVQRRVPIRQSPRGNRAGLYVAQIGD